jgi:PAS domain S-box-containing protein
MARQSADIQAADGQGGVVPSGGGTATYAFIAVDRDWKITYIDTLGSAQQLRGLVGINFWEAFPDVVGTPFDDRYHEAMATGNPVEIEDFYPPFQMWLHVHAQPSERGLSLYFRDVSERRLVEQRVEHERQRLHDLLMQIPAAVAILRGPTHIFELTNPLYQRLVGETDLIGKPARQALPELTARGVWDRFDTVYRTGEPLIGDEFPAQLDRKGDGTLEQGYFNFVGQPIRDDSGAIEGVLIHAVDVTTQVIARQRVEELARQLDGERERFALAQKAARIGTFEWDIPNDRTVWTPELEALYGLPPGGFEGRYENWARRIHPDDLPTVNANRQAAVAPGTGYREEFRVVWPDGSIRWLLASAEVYYENGQPTRMVGVNLDITERKLIEENLAFLAQASKILASSLDYETTLAQVARLGVPRIADWCAVDMRGESGAIEQLALAHVDPDKVQWARELNKANPPDPDAPTGVPNVLRTGRSEYYPEITDEMLVAAVKNEEELELARRLQLASIMTVPMRVHEVTIGAITFVGAESGRHYTQADLAIAEEVASRAALAVENARLYREAQQAVAVRDEFMSLASHELKTPVTSLKMYTQVLQRQAERRGEADMADRFVKMDRQIDKLTGLINDLLNVARIEGGRLEYLDESFDLNTVVREAVDAVQSTTAKQTITIEGALDTPIWGDGERIGQVVTNLLTNAVKYSPQADRVIVRLAREGEMAIISVQDFGIGIDDEQQQQIFDQFYRVSDPSEKTYPGLGLGLYIASEIVKRHSGAVVVQSAKGQGATFTVTLPLMQQNRADSAS